MRRTLQAGLMAAGLLVAMVPTVSAAPKDEAGCPNASRWEEGNVSDVAAGFFPHLFPGQFATVADFAAEIDAAFDKNGDDLVCTALKVYDNPNSHLYKVGIAVVGEPAHLLFVRDNNANAT